MKGIKQLTHATRLAAAALGCVLFAACGNDDLFGYGGNGSGTDYISFGLNEAHRAPANPQTTARMVLRTNAGSDTLCVRAVVTNGITASRFETDAPATRATPIDNIDTYGAFRVLAYCSQGGVTNEVFYLNDTADMRNGSLWTTTQKYYWPEPDYLLRFSAWAPCDAPGTTPQSPADNVLSYTVPRFAGEQSDLVVALTPDMNNGSTQAAVPLTFNHICTQVRFALGTAIQPGSIERIAIEGVRYNGTYRMETGNEGWTLSDATADFSLTTAFNTTGGTAGTEVAPTDSALMMLPQILPEGASLVVDFNDRAVGKRTLRASLAGQAWPIGKTVTYRLSITPEYELEFASEPALQDAHYVIYPIEIKAGPELAGKKWEVTSDASWVTLRSDLTNLEKDGFWIDPVDDKRTVTATGDATGTTMVYAFLEENPSSTETRTAKLTLRLSGTEGISDVFTIQQLPAHDCGPFLCERLEEGEPAPWGFAWDGVTEDFETSQGGAGHIPPGQEKQYINAFKTQFPEWNQWNFIQFTPQQGVLIRIDYSKITVNVSTSTDDGWNNTKSLYNFKGIDQLASIKDWLLAFGAIYTLNSGSVTLTNPTYYAALNALKRNKFHMVKEQETVNNTTVTVQKPVLYEEDIHWYLPAQNQYGGINDEVYPLSGEYWTSTSVAEGSNNTQAYTYAQPTQTTQPRPRMDLYGVRAIRRK